MGWVWLTQTLLSQVFKLLYKHSACHIFWKFVLLEEFFLLIRFRWLYVLEVHFETLLANVFFLFFFLIFTLR